MCLSDLNLLTLLTYGGRNLGNHPEIVSIQLAWTKVGEIVWIVHILIN